MCGTACVYPALCYPTSHIMHSIPRYRTPPRPDPRVGRVTHGVGDVAMGATDFRELRLASCMARCTLHNRPQENTSQWSIQCGLGPVYPRKMGPIHPQIVYSDLFDCICDVSYLQYIRCI